MADAIDEESLELIDVRLGIDVAKLQAYVHAQRPQLRGFGPRCAPPRVKQFNKGQSNPTYLVQPHGGALTPSYVLRKKPPGRLLRGAHAGCFGVIESEDATELPFCVIIDLPTGGSRSEWLARDDVQSTGVDGKDAFDAAFGAGARGSLSGWFEFGASIAAMASEALRGQFKSVSWLRSAGP